MPKREKRPRRMAWFAMDVDAFLEDSRMQTLSNKEKSAWALMIIKGFRNKGIIITDPQIVAEQTGLKLPDAKALLAKLYQNNLITPTEKIFEAISSRLVDEYIRAVEAYEKKSNAGKISGEKHGTANLKLVKTEANDVA